MKFVFTSFVGSVWASLTLKDVYGPIEPVESMRPPWSLDGARLDRSDNFFARRRAETCDFSLNVLLLQDTTASFYDNFDVMQKTELPSMVDNISKSHPGSQFGGMSFRDKPITPFGNPSTDYCQEISLDFTSNETQLYDYYAGLTRIGGGDPPENQFGALMAAGQTSRLSWTLNRDSANLIVLVTDASPHFAGDGYDPQGMTPNPGLFVDELAERHCLQHYYPTPDQVLFSIQAAEAYLAVVVFDPEYWNGIPGSSWQWFNRFAGQPDDFVRLAARDNSGFWEQLSEVISKIEEIECFEATTAKPATTLNSGMVSEGTLPLTEAPIPSPTPADTSALTTTPTSAQSSPPTSAQVEVSTTGPVATTTTEAPSNSQISATTTFDETYTVDATVEIITAPAYECEMDEYCVSGVNLRFVRKPEDLEVVVDGKRIDI